MEERETENKRERQRLGRKRDRDLERREQRSKEREGQRPTERGGENPRRKGIERFRVGQGQRPREKDARSPGRGPPGYCPPLGWCVGMEWGCLELCTWSQTSLPLTSPRLVLHALADLVQGPGHLWNPHHGPCPPGLCGGPEGVPLPPGPGECPFPLHP